MPETVAFYLFSALAIGASALVIGQRNPMYSVMLLIASFGALSGLYILLDAPFAAVAQIIIYAGAIMVLFLFVVMLLNTPQEDAATYDRTHPLRADRVSRDVGSQTGSETVSSVRELGRVLFERHGFAFEATSILILVAMVGAVVLARREDEPS